MIISSWSYALVKIQIFYDQLVSNWLIVTTHGRAAASSKENWSLPEFVRYNPNDFILPHILPTQACTAHHRVHCSTASQKSSFWARQSPPRAIHSQAIVDLWIFRQSTADLEQSRFTRVKCGEATCIADCDAGKLWQGQELVLPLFTAAYASASDLSGSIHVQTLAGCHMALALRLGQQGEVKTAGHPDASQIPFGAPDSWRQWQDLKPQCIRKESIAIAGPMMRGQDIQKLPGTTQKSVGAGDPVSISLMPHDYAPNREELMGGVVKWVQREGHFSGLKGATVTAIGVYCTSKREDGHFSAKIGASHSCFCPHAHL